MSRRPAAEASASLSSARVAATAGPADYARPDGGPASCPWGDRRATRASSPTTSPMLQSLADFVGVALEQRVPRGARTLGARGESPLRGFARTPHADASREVLLNQILDAVVRPLRPGELQPAPRRAGRARASPSSPAGESGRRAGSTRRFRSTVRALVARRRAECETLNVADVSADPRYLEGWRDARSELVVPLKLDGEVVGVLDMESRLKGAFTPEDERTLSAFADARSLSRSGSPTSSPSSRRGPASSRR